LRPGELLLKEKEEHMFLGQYQHAIDDKGRLTIPARFRELLEGGAFVTQGFDKNLMVMTESYFKLVYERLSSMSITDPGTRQLRRMILGNAYPVEVDKVGRVLLPQGLRQFLA
jgi:MraZ protein